MAIFDFEQEEEQQNPFHEVWAGACSNIYKFCEFIRFEPHSEQRKLFDIVQYLVDSDEVPKRALAKAGTGVGKSSALAVIALWLLVRKKNVRGIITAKTEAQTKAVFFREVRSLLSKAPPEFSEIFTIRETKIHIKGHVDWAIETIVASTVTGAQGRHDADQFVLIEEISDIDEGILEALFGTQTQGGNITIGIGNPNFRSGQLFRAFHSESDHWPNKITMNKLLVSVERPDLVDPRVIQDIKNRHGEDSDQWRVRVLGEFPYSGENSVIDLKALRAAVQQEVYSSAVTTNPHVRRIVMDFARYGKDNSVIAARAGNAIIHLEVMRGHVSPITVARRAIEIENELGFDSEEILYIGDGVGVGGPALDLLTLDFERNVFEFGSNRQSQDIRYDDMASMAWFNLADMLKDHPVYLGVSEDNPDVEELRDELAQRTYTVLSDKLQTKKVEPKDKFKQRNGGKSPDLSDTITMAFYDGVDDLGSGEVWTPNRTEKQILDLTSEYHERYGNKIVDSPQYNFREIIPGRGNNMLGRSLF